MRPLATDRPLVAVSALVEELQYRAGHVGHQDGYHKLELRSG